MSDGKRWRGRSAREMPDTSENIAKAVLRPLKRDWDYLKEPR